MKNINFEQVSSDYPMMIYRDRNISMNYMKMFKFREAKPYYGGQLVLYPQDVCLPTYGLLPGEMEYEAIESWTFRCSSENEVKSNLMRVFSQLRQDIRSVEKPIDIAEYDDWREVFLERCQDFKIEDDFYLSIQPDLVELYESFRDCHTWIHRLIAATKNGDRAVAKHWFEAIQSRMSKIDASSFGSDN